MFLKHLAVEGGGGVQFKKCKKLYFSNEKKTASHLKLWEKNPIKKGVISSNIIKIEKDCKCDSIEILGILILF